MRKHMPPSPASVAPHSAAGIAHRLAEIEPLFMDLPVAMALAEDPGLEAIRINRALARLLGRRGTRVARNTLLGHYRSCRFFSDGQPLSIDQLPMPRAVATSSVVVSIGLEIHRADGSVVPVFACATPLIDYAGKVCGCMETYVDITARQDEVEELRRKLQSALDQGYRLQRTVREIHHRVKNNLNALVTLADRAVTEGAESVPVSQLQRITFYMRTMAALHELLTVPSVKENATTHVSAGEVMERLVPLLKALASPRLVRLNVQNLALPMAHATALAMLVNEIVSNCIKHGKGVIEIDLTSNGHARLEVCDSGQGFPEGFNPIAHANTGMELINIFSRWDLLGDVSYYNRPEGGACVAVTFPIKA